MGFISDSISIACIIAGVLSLLKYKNRKFNRTNEFGVEQFGSYSEKLKSKAKDSFLAGCAIFFVVFGTIVLAFHYEDSWGWIVLAPVLAILAGIWIPGQR